MKMIALVLPHLAFQHIKEAFLHMYNFHGLPNLRNLKGPHLYCLYLFFKVCSTALPSSFCSLASLAECFMTPQLMCYSA